MEATRTDSLMIIKSGCCRFQVEISRNYDVTIFPIAIFTFSNHNQKSAELSSELSTLITGDRILRTQGLRVQDVPRAFRSCYRSLVAKEC